MSDWILMRGVSGEQGWYNLSTGEWRLSKPEGTISLNVGSWLPELKRERLTHLQEQNIIAKEIQNRELSLIYDKNKADLYRNKLYAYNTNAFGFGLSGTLRWIDPITPLLQEQVLSNANYTLSNFNDFLANLLINGGASYGINILPKGLRYLGKIAEYEPNYLGEGAESFVYDVAPNLVMKVSMLPLEEMLAKNTVPNYARMEYAGDVLLPSGLRPAFLLLKLRLVSDEGFDKVLKKLDRNMLKKGYRAITGSTGDRAYINGNKAVVDITADNIGKTWFGKPKLFDFSLLDISELPDLGFTIK